jgi:hypothetical protein
VRFMRFAKISQLMGRVNRQGLGLGL